MEGVRSVRSVRSVRIGSVDTGDTPKGLLQLQASPTTYNLVHASETGDWMRIESTAPVTADWLSGG